MTLHKASGSFMALALLALVCTIGALGQDPAAEAFQKQKAYRVDGTILTSDRGTPTGSYTDKVDPKVRAAVAQGLERVPVFIVLSTQPHRSVLDRYENPEQTIALKLQQMVEPLFAANTDDDARQPLYRDNAEKALLAARQAAFREIEKLIQQEQEDIEAMLLQVGANNIHRYKAVNMIRATVPYNALNTIAMFPSVAEIALVEQHFTQLATSVPAFGARVFWDSGYTGAGESVAVLDTGINNSHPAFTGLNIVSRVFLKNAKQDPYFNDNANSPLDNQGHGTHVSGIVASRGAPGCTNCMGVARGLGSLYSLKVGYRASTGTGLFYDDDTIEALDWLVQQATWVSIINYSVAGAANVDDDFSARVFDYFADTYGLTFAVAAGNDSKSGILGLYTDPGPIGSPGIAYNVITVAAMNTQGTIDRSDDRIAIFSSQGPTAGGRKKPDIAAPGGFRDVWRFTGYQAEGGIYSADHASSSFVAKNGTSMAAPHIAGAAALLRSAGIRDPLKIKALLLNTTDTLTWSKDTGWGYGNLARAFEQRSNTTSDTLPSGRVRLYKGISSGLFYATLVWNRAVAWNRSMSATPLSGCLSDLDLYLYNGSSGALLSSSDSTVDNVEKTYVNYAGTVAHHDFLDSLLNYCHAAGSRASRA